MFKSQAESTCLPSSCSPNYHREISYFFIPPTPNSLLSPGLNWLSLLIVHYQQKLDIDFYSFFLFSSPKKK
jgi:hypothetical protein